MRTFARSFNGGEVTPEFYGQLADAKFQTGLARCRNFLVKPHGPLENRGGFQFVREVKDSAERVRLLPFIFSPTQTFVIETGAGYFRFHTEGATLLSGLVPLEAANPYTEGDLFRIRYAQSNDVVTLVSTAHPPAELRRLGPTSWSYDVVAFGNPLPPPAAVIATATPAGSPPGTPTVQSYVVTSVSADGAQESLQSTGGVPFAVQAVTQDNPGRVRVGLGAALAPGDDVYVSALGGMNELNNRFFEVDTITDVYEYFPYPIDDSLLVGYDLTLTDGGVPVDTTGYTAYTYGGVITKLGGGSTCSNNLFDSGAYNTIAWAPAAGAARYNVYKLTNGLFGFIGQTEQTSFTDDNIAGDIGRTPPTDDVPFQGAGNYPGAVGYFEQRRFFAGTLNQPASVWGTRTGTESNFNYSIPLRADDSIRFRVASRESHTFRHVVALSNLMLLSDSAEWRVSPNGGEALSASDGQSVRVQSYIGAGEATPVLANNNLVFAAARGGHIRELAYSWQANGYVTGDMSLRAPHLFDGLEIVDIAYAKAPYPVVWVVSTSGKLLGLTYVPEQDVGAWHVHETDGVFESIAVVPEGPDDVLYAVVRRTIGGAQKRFVERMAPRRDEFFVDSGLRYSGAPAAVFSGLGHLEGREVAIIADGAVQPRQTVTGGAVTLETAARYVDVGLPYVSDAQTLPPVFDIEAYGQGRPKRPVAAWVRVVQSRGLQAGPSFDRLASVPPRRFETYGSPPEERTDEIKVVLPPGWDYGGAVCLRQSEPLPLTVVALSVEYSVGG